ncbi:MFS transporter [Pseudonocardia sp. NPDC046786]|uniref:MFS transporter n=1 Tax=Pseudonocardia sp. NPDC046786 TaxID=3155471 RepID=UPI0033BFD14A
MTRELAAFANAGFLAVALTLALVAGVPGGALLGQALGWRSTFWTVAALAAVGLAGILLRVPPTRDGDRVGGIRPTRALPVLLCRRALLTMLVGALVDGGTFAVYVYLGPVLTGAAALPLSAVPAGLGVFGVGAVLGVALAGRYADAHGRRLLTVGAPVLAAGWMTTAALAGTGWPLAWSAAGPLWSAVALVSLAVVPVLLARDDVV